MGLLKFNSLPIRKKAELNYTTTNNKQKEGIYITDVSEIVEEVMPSIVSITSKTLVSSGNFGPSFFNQNQYAEGAGSGIIISQTDSELLILTNNHVVDGAEELSIQFVNEKSVDAKIKGASERKDERQLCTGSDFRL
jgi:serine protease Do